ncbi:MAG: hypothetical protein H7326_05760 [Bdellovibrionaceae bacterium]|nr:hypothetical protein [Pseudobdellovibrionaceae bacterium]
MKHTLAIALVLSLMTISSAKAQSQDSEGADFGSTAASVFKVDGNNNYKDNLALREARKIGVAFGVGGTLGLYGMNIEVNFEDENAGYAGFGGGEGFRSFNIGWKHTFEGDTIAPYASTGYSRWYDSSDGGTYKNSAILDRVLSNSQKESGRFAADFISGALGLQYTQLAGYMAGSSVFAEVVLLGELNSSVLVPTGSVGGAYYF